MLRLSLFLLVLFQGGVTVAFADQERELPYNLLVIQTDEHNFRTLGCYRQTLTPDQAFIWGRDAVVETPHIDSIAQRGAICTSFYATSPVCTPSRASFFTGFYPQHTGSPQNNLPMLDRMVTFAEVLKSDGYVTGYAGKWHLNGNGKPEWSPKRRFGFEDNRYMFNRGHWKHFQLTDSGPIVGSRNKKGEPNYFLKDADEKTFATDWLTDRAVDFIRANSEKPFCYHLSLPDPHGPNAVRQPYDTKYADQTIRAPKTFSMSKENPNWALSMGKKLQFSPIQMAKYFGMVRCIDDNVGKLLKCLADETVLDRTIIVFTSDHGDLCYEHGRLNKGNPYEASAKIPMIICAPKLIPAGLRIDRALGTVDFAPTVLSLLSKRAPKGTQGRDASSLFIEASAVDEWTDVAILRNAGTKANWMAAVSDRYKLVLSVNEKPWLMDLQEDPDELKNHFGNPSKRSQVKELANGIASYGKRYGDPYLENKKIASDLEAILNQN